MPQFLTANVVALCAYFATFAVFFFTALYLAEVAGYSGYQIALIFLPMTALMTLTSLLAGRWTVTAGSRWSVLSGVPCSAPACCLPRSPSVPARASRSSPRRSP